MCVCAEGEKIHTSCILPSNYNVFVSDMQLYLVLNQVLSTVNWASFIVTSVSLRCIELCVRIFQFLSADKGAEQCNSDHLLIKILSETDRKRFHGICMNVSPPLLISSQTFIEATTFNLLLYY